MKSYVATSSDPANPEKFLAYMVPAPGEVWIKCYWILI
jgi:RNA polymerase II-associated factor 1